MNRCKKRAFTTADMLISFLCIGLLGIAIVSFAATVNTYKARVKAREKAILSEYQDVLKLETYGYGGYSNNECELTKSDRLINAKTMDVGESKYFITSLTGLVGSGQRVVWSCEDDSICNVDQEGRVTAKVNGMTVIKAVISNTDGAGHYDETEYVQYFPVHVGASYDNSMWFVYVGDYYRYWLSSSDTGAQKHLVRLEAGIP